MSAREQLTGPAPEMGPLRPTAEDLRISARILLLLARQPRVGRGEVALPSLTQAGLAASLGTTPSAVSNCLRRLVAGGAVDVETAHVRHQWRRLKIYQLTPTGERLVRHIQASIGEMQGSARADSPPR